MAKARGPGWAVAVAAEGAPPAVRAARGLSTLTADQGRPHAGIPRWPPGSRQLVDPPRAAASLVPVLSLTPGSPFGERGRE